MDDKVSLFAIGCRIEDDNVGLQIEPQVFRQLPSTDVQAAFMLHRPYRVASVGRGKAV